MIISISRFRLSCLHFYLRVLSDSVVKARGGIIRIDDATNTKLLDKSLITIVKKSGSRVEPWGAQLRTPFQIRYRLSQIYTVSDWKDEVMILQASS